MQWKYKATRKDFGLVKRALNLVWSEKLNLIFTDKKLISEVNVVSFDSEYLYLWIKKEKNNWKINRIKHKLKFSESDRKSWGAWSDPKIICLLPINLQWNFSIIGSLPAVFINTHKKIKNSIYNTEDSFMATIIHEFAHIYCRSYWDKFKTNKSKIIAFLKGNFEIGEIEPPPSHLEEVFAFCVEYEISKMLFPKHSTNMDKSDKEYLDKIIEQEKSKTKKQASVFAKENSNHVIAMVLGRKLIKKYPTNWKEKILNFTPISF